MNENSAIKITNTRFTRILLALHCRCLKHMKMKKATKRQAKEIAIPIKLNTTKDMVASAIYCQKYNMFKE